MLDFIPHIEKDSPLLGLLLALFVIAIVLGLAHLAHRDQDGDER